MKPVGPVLAELRGIVSGLREELDSTPAGPILVTGMLAEQLARQLAEGAEPGAVVALDPSRLARSSVLVHVMAGEPSPADVELVHEADGHGVPVVLVQLWPQEDWKPPFVLTPFVVECQPGVGFPMSQIAARIVEIVENPVALGRRIPVLEEKVAEAVVGLAVVRAGLLALTRRRSRAARPVITLEQIRMLTSLRLLRRGSPPPGPDAAKVLAPLGVAAVGAGLVFRGAARAARRALPGPLVDVTVAAVGTWALGEALRRLDV
jgi:hypothetical protein